MNSKTKQLLSRRDLLNATTRLTMTGLFGAIVVGCSKSPSLLCSDAARLSDAENSLRASLNYNEHSPRKDQSCAGCGFFEASGNSECGTCTLLKGPVNPSGRCDSWSAARMPR